MSVDDLFRLSIGIRDNPEVDHWFNKRPDELGRLAQDWFNVMRSMGDDVLELVHDGHPVACIEDVPFAYVNVFTRHVNVGFFRGAELRDPSSLLQGSGKRMRHVKVSPVVRYDAEGLEQLIDEAYQDLKRLL